MFPGTSQPQACCKTYRMGNHIQKDFEIRDRLELEGVSQIDGDKNKSEHQHFEIRSERSSHAKANQTYPQHGSRLWIDLSCRNGASALERVQSISLHIMNIIQGI